MDGKTANFLLSAAGRSAIQPLAGVDLGPTQTLSLLQDLRRSLPGELAGALLTLARLRQQAQRKFEQADRLFFLPEALEQATAAEIAHHRAAWIHHHASPGPILDLGCGIGGDSLALARFRSVIAYETDPIRLRFAQANAEVLGVADRIRFCLADWTIEAVQGTLPKAAAAFADPDRRRGEQRLFSLHTMQPPLHHLLDLLHSLPALGVKVMPGVRDEELPAQCGVEFISHEQRCKEAVLWFGPLRGEHSPGQRWASVHGPQGWRQLSAQGIPAPVGPLNPGDLLHEPDGAVIRAGGLAELCAELGAHLFDPHIAYLVGAQREEHPLTQCFRILEVQPTSLKQLNRRLQALGIGRVELKKRGAPMEPETLRPRIRTAPGVREGVVIFTRRTIDGQDEHLTLICERLSHYAGENG